METSILLLLIYFISIISNIFLPLIYNSCTLFIFQDENENVTILEISNIKNCLYLKLLKL